MRTRHDTTQNKKKKKTENNVHANFGLICRKKSRFTFHIPEIRTSEYMKYHYRWIYVYLCFFKSIAETISNLKV